LAKFCTGALANDDNHSGEIETRKERWSEAEVNRIAGKSA